MLRNSVQAATLSPLSTAALTGAYQAFTALPAACFLLHFTNTGTDRTVTISYDGVNDHDVVPFGTSFQVLAGNAGSSPQNSTALFPKGLVIYAKGAGGGAAGDVYLAAYYQVSQ
jgi:hypothetical protein